jgi:CheY-like chemotaxis protein
MPRILAIEADTERSRLLTTLVREHVQADLAFAESVQAAISVIGDEPPDVILAPALLSPPDEAALLSHVKEIEAARHIQILTIPALDMLVEPPVEKTRAIDVFVSIFRPRRPRAWLVYDPQMVASQIADCLTHARELRAEREMELAFAEALAEFDACPGKHTQALCVTTGVSKEEPALSQIQIESLQSADRRRAHRRSRNDVPWLSSITMSCGLEVRLINISTTGVLIETGSKFAPGSTTELRLTGSGTDTIVTVRFVRSEVARIDALGIKYYAAAAFENEVDLVGPRRDVWAPASPAQAVAGLLATGLD